MSNDKQIVVFSGYNMRAVISFLRTLADRGVPYLIIAKDADDPIFKTRYKEKVRIVRKTRELRVDVFQKYVQEIQGDGVFAELCVAPSTEALNRFLLKERHELESMGVEIPLVDEVTYASVSDKMAFSEICREQGVSVPGEYSSINEVVFPFVAKPKRYFAKDGSVHSPFLIFNQGQLNAFLKSCDPSDFYFQEYVEGRSLYLLYYFHRSGQVFRFSQENIAQQPGGKSIVAAVSSDYHQSEVALQYEELFSGLGFMGLVMVELKVNEKGSFMIEANPRFWGPSQLFVDAGMNFFEAFLHDYGFVVEQPSFADAKASRYFWSGGARATLREQAELVFHTRESGTVFKNMMSWLDYDIYRRPDTMELFKEETD